MIKRLELKNLGPCVDMPPVEFGDRLNVITGDNGLGKSFLLDLVWWALTRKWPAEINQKLTAGTMALPSGKGDARITFTIKGASRNLTYETPFDRELQAWKGSAGRPSNPGLVLYAMVDGSFALWDPHRNYWRRLGEIDVQERQPAYVFGPREVWDGLRNETTQLCNGLISDWASWQREKGRPFELLLGVLDTLAGTELGTIRSGEIRKISLDDARMYPTLRMPYGMDVPLHQCSAGMRRIFAIAYLLVWAWEEHCQAGRLLGKEPTNQITFLVDEIEAHLHPKWQRTIAGSILKVMQALSRDASVQLIAATHSPLLLSSLESVFDSNRDAWFDLDLVSGEVGLPPKVVFTKRPFFKMGDASAWLTSEAFDLKYAHSSETELVLLEAEKALTEPDFGIEKARSLHKKLKEYLSETDPFWLRWLYVAKGKGWVK